MDKDIKRFCELINEINSINKQLDKERANFYYGGYSFEECNKYTIEELEKLETEFKKLFKVIYAKD